MPSLPFLKSKKIIIACVTILVIAVGIFVITQDNNTTPPQAQTNLQQFSEGGISFKYPEGYMQQPKPKAQVNQANSIVKLAEDNPIRIIEVAKETGAIVGANSTNKNFLDFLESSAARGFPVRYKGYKLEQTKRISIAGHDASKITFTYTGTDGKTILYMHFFIIPAGNDAYYATVQSTDQPKADSDAQSLQNSLQIN